MVMREVSGFAKKMETLEEQRQQTQKMTQISDQIKSGFGKVDDKFENLVQNMLEKFKVVYIFKMTFCEYNYTFSVFRVASRTKV